MWEGFTGFVMHDGGDNIDKHCKDIVRISYNSAAAKIDLKLKYKINFKN